MESLLNLFLSSTGVTTDTRTIEDNNIYFALKGDNFDGNQFAQQAIDKGAKAAVIDDPAYVIEGKTILVDNTLITLQQLAMQYRNKLKIPIVGLTGSNGKTTTKELFFAVLSQEFKCHATKGNLNNHIGVPLTILDIPKNAEVAIIEMGANHLKEIELLCSIAQPTIGYITNFGKAHLEGFGGVEGVIKGKSELYDYLKGSQGTVIINADDEIQVQQSKTIESRFSFSIDDIQANLFLEVVSTFPKIELIMDRLHIHSNLYGEYNATNVMAAMALGKYFGMNTQNIKDGVESYIPSNNRSEVLEYNGRTIILDAYNANPSSMSAAINNFSKIEGKKSLVLGDMFELGEYAELEHQKIVNLLQNLGLKQVYLVGEQFIKTQSGYKSFSNLEDLVAYKDNHFLKDFDYLLVKGSRKMALERIVDYL